MNSALGEVPVGGDGVVRLGEEGLALLVVHRPQVGAVLGQHGLYAVDVHREDGLELLLRFCWLRLRTSEWR